jgi:hypothetical protein
MVTQGENLKMNKKNCLSKSSFGDLSKDFGGIKSEKIEILITRLKKLSHLKDFCILRQN